MNRTSKHVGSGGSQDGTVRARFADFSSETGQALVELALALPLLISLIIGAIDLGRLVYMAVGASNAAHAGAQYGCQNPATAADLTGMQTAAANDASDLVGAGNGNLAATATNFCQCADGSGQSLSCASPPACANTHVVEYVNVSTTVNYTPWFAYPGVPSSVTVHGSAVMQVGQ
jgi:Flp pilus assembly protein TadG